MTGGDGRGKKPPVERHEGYPAFYCTEWKEDPVLERKFSTI